MFRQLLIATVCLGLLAPVSVEARLGARRAASVKRAKVHKPFRLRARARLRLLRSRLGRLRIVKATKRTVRSTVRRFNVKRLRRRARASLRRLARRDRRQVRSLLAAPRVRSSVSARYAVGAFLMLRAGKGGEKLPLSYADMKQIVGSKRWTTKRLRNLGRVLSLARDISVQEKVSPEVAYARALKRLGIYGKVSRQVCGA